MAFLYVKAYHGPCTTFNCQSHKPGYLTGLQSRLRKLGFRVDLVPVDFVNYCMLEMCGFQIFRCNIRQLRFNTSYERDVVCQRAIKAVMDSSIKFRRARAILWLLTLLDRELFNRSENAPLDYWISKIKIKEGKPFASGIDCLDCCKINIKIGKDNENEQTQSQHTSKLKDIKNYVRAEEIAAPPSPVPTQDTRRTSAVKFK